MKSRRRRTTPSGSGSTFTNPMPRAAFNRSTNSLSKRSNLKNAPSTGSESSYTKRSTSRPSGSRLILGSQFRESDGEREMAWWQMPAARVDSMSSSSADRSRSGSKRMSNPIALAPPDAMKSMIWAWYQRGH